MKLSPSLIMTLIFAIQLSSCATTGNDKIEGLESKNIFAAKADQVVVQKIGKKKPVISPYGSSHWIKNRESKSMTIQTIQGMLATNEALGAERLARKYLAKNPGDIEGLTALSSALAMSKQYDLAAYYAKLISKKLPENPHSLNIQGLAALMGAKRIEEFKRAERLFQRSFDSSDSEIAAGLNLGNLYLELGNSQAALKIFQTTEKRCSDCVPSLMGHGIAARRLGKNEEALVAFNKLLDQEEEHAPALYHKALVYRDGYHDNKKAEESLRVLLESPTIASVQKRQAHALLRSIRALNPRNQAVADESTDKSGSLLSLEEDSNEGRDKNSVIESKEPSSDEIAKSDLDILEQEIDNQDEESQQDDFEIAAKNLEKNQSSGELTVEDSDFETVAPIDATANRKSKLDSENTINTEFETQGDSDDSF
jgi:tetratricopeptide (TPR) repeat protein